MCVYSLGQAVGLQQLRQCLCMVVGCTLSAIFGFFGFFGKVAAFIGPTVYFFMAVMYDSRAGIFSIAVLLLIGLVLLYMVDVEAGRKDAQEEDQRIRKNLDELSNLDSMHNNE